MKNTNTNDKYTKITIALAGIYQVGQLVDSLALTGQCDQKAYDASIASLFKINAKDVVDVYGSLENLKPGFKELLIILDKHKEQKPNPQISRYAMSLILVEQELSKNQEMMQEIRRRINHVQTQIDYFSEVNDTVIANLADIYIKTISTFRRRIQIIGNAPQLKNEAVTNKIRALLLAGVRSAMLWQQVGGTRWQLFLNRSKIYNVAHDLL